MNNVTYYQEHTRPITDPNAIPLNAVLVVNTAAESFISLNRETVNAIGAMDNNSNTSKICRSLEVEREYLENFCKVIDEVKARQIHSNLFKYIEENGLS